MSRPEEEKEGASWAGVQFSLVPHDEAAAKLVYVNGKNVEPGQMLTHNDRIIFGNTAVFIFKNPDQGLARHKAGLLDDPELSEERRGEIEAMTEYEDDEAEIYTWEFAQKEVQANHKV